MKDSKGGFMVDDDEARKDESEAILKKREAMQQLKKPFFDPGMAYGDEVDCSSQSGSC
jgi:hypothetical protein